MGSNPISATTAEVMDSSSIRTANNSKLMNEVDLKELKLIIGNIVREELQKYVITEMAMSLKDYKQRVENLMPQILENWCLIRYTSLTGKKQELRNHWSKELKAHINNIAAIKVKSGNKTNALYHLWNMYDWDTDEQSIARRLITKFEIENLPTTGPIFAQIVSDFKNETTNLVKILTSDFDSEVAEYIKNI